MVLQLSQVIVFLRAAQRENKVLKANLKFKVYSFTEYKCLVSNISRVSHGVVRGKSVVQIYKKTSTHHTVSSLDNQQKRKIWAVFGNFQKPQSFFHVFYKNLSSSLRGTKCMLHLEDYIVAEYVWAWSIESNRDSLDSLNSHSRHLN